MPSWNVHLEAGNRIADKLKLAPKDRQEFIFGCLLPDINNAYVNHPHIHKTHEETHYSYASDPVLEFYSKYQPEIDGKNPIYLGYLFHIYTDNFFNHDFEEKIKGTKFSEQSEEEQEHLKHNDFWLYGLNFRYVPDIFLDDVVALVEKANQIEPVEINADDITELVGIIRTDEINDGVRDNQYILYTKEDFDKLINNVCKNFSKTYLEKT